jgi:hypothetical protein
MVGVLLKKVPAFAKTGLDLKRVFMLNLGRPQSGYLKLSLNGAPLNQILFSEIAWNDGIPSRTVTNVGHSASTTSFMSKRPILVLFGVPHVSGAFMPRMDSM